MATHFIRFEDILGSTTDNGELRVNLGDLQSGKGNGASQPVWGMAGFYHRPADPDQDGCAQGGYFVDGNNKRVFVTRDNRVAKDMPELKPGETMMASFAGQFIRCHEDGGISLYTTHDGTPNGQQITLSISPTEGLVFTSPWGGLKIGPNGNSFYSAAGPALNMGAIGGLSIPGVDVSSYASLSGGAVSVTGSALALGIDCGLANEAAVNQLLLWMGAVEVSLSALGAPPSVSIATPSVLALLKNIGKVS